jgi:transcriptional regulator with XRE-family HTH domain
LRVYEFPDPDVRAIRKGAAVSQAEFARLIGINVRTLQNWEQGRRASAAEDRGVESEVGDEGVACLEAEGHRSVSQPRTRFSDPAVLDR